MSNLIPCPKMIGQTEDGEYIMQVDVISHEWKVVLEVAKRRNGLVQPVLDGAWQVVFEEVWDAYTYHNVMQAHQFAVEQEEIDERGMAAAGHSIPVNSVNKDFPWTKCNDGWCADISDLQNDDCFVNGEVRLQYGRTLWDKFIPHKNKDNEITHWTILTCGTHYTIFND